MQFYYSAEEHNSAPLTFANVRASKKAAQFSEDYFRSLYRRKMNGHLKRMREYSTEAFEEKWPRDFNRLPDEFETGAEYEAARAEYLERRNEAMEDWQPEPWNEASERADFERSYRAEMQYLSRVLPQEILNAVADLRVLALGMAAPDVKRQILALCRENRRREAERQRALQDHFTRMRERHPGSFIEKLSLHDAVFAQTCRQGRQLVLRMNDVPGREETPVEVCFADCEILKMQDDLIGSEWLYAEVHEDGDRFIVHVLTFNRNREGYTKYDELTLRCRDAELK